MYTRPDVEREVHISSPVPFTPTYLDSEPNYLFMTSHIWNQNDLEMLWKEGKMTEAMMRFRPRVDSVLAVGHPLQWMSQPR